MYLINKMYLPTISELEEKNRLFESGAHNLTKESFTFISQLGSGAFGKVYKVSSKITNQIYALKVLSKNQISNLNLIDQLKNEITILARCNHDNIIKLYCAFEDKGYIFLVMELANDSTLFNKVKKLKKLSEPLVCDYMKDIVQAVVYLHSQNPIILHRDIKPENILITNSRCKIADFGWSNVDDEFRNTFCGTPDYLAPEMISGTGHNEKLDVWTLGVLMYELLHGHPPFSPKEKPNDARMIQKIIEKNILNGVIDFDQSISPEARSAIVTMLNPKDTLRPQAKDILDLEFFKKYSKNVVQKSPSGTNLFGQMQSSSTKTLLDGDSNVMRQKIRECEARIESLMANNKHMSELIDNKDSLFRAQKIEFDSLFHKYAKSIEETKSFKDQIEGLKSENSSLKSKSESNKKDFENSTAENRRIRHELGKQEETVAYLFKRTKNISTSISEFFQNYVAQQDLNVTQDYILSYDNTVQKLDAIFKDFVYYKNKSMGTKLPVFQSESLVKAKTDTKTEPVKKTSNQPGEKKRDNSFSPYPRKSSSPVRTAPDNKSAKMVEIQKEIMENEQKLKNYFNKSENKSK
jgi:serine/threonine protein kinase